MILGSDFVRLSLRPLPCVSCLFSIFLGIGLVQKFSCCVAQVLLSGCIRTLLAFTLIMFCLLLVLSAFLFSSALPNRSSQVLHSQCN